MISKDIAQRRITVLWFVLFAVIFCLLIAQSIVVKDKNVIAAWGWFLPLTLPILSLMSSVMVLQANGTIKLKGKVSRFTYNLTVFTSAFYLLVVLITLISASLIEGFEEELFSQSGLWLGPLQGIVGAFIGVFFVKDASNGE